MLSTIFKEHQKLSHLLIKSQKNILNYRTGHHTSSFKGEGYDFVELRAYEHGDNIHDINWIVSAKHDKLYVKLFAPQKELNITLVPLLSDTLFFGTTILKQEFVNQISLTLAYATLSQNDSFESYLGSEDLTLATSRSKNIHTLIDFSQQLDDFNVRNKSLDYNSLFKKLFEKLQHPSTLFLIGDFFNTASFNPTALVSKHELYVIIVRDRFEETPLALGEINITKGSKTKAKKVVLDKLSIQKYTKDLQLHDIQLYETLHKNGIKFIKIYTDEEPTRKLLELMNR